MMAPVPHELLKKKVYLSDRILTSVPVFLMSHLGHSNLYLYKAGIKSSFY